MKERIFICTTDPFPFGTANSNYIRNFSKCLISADYKVIVIGVGKNRDCDKAGEKFFYGDVEYHNIDMVIQGPKNSLKAHLFAGSKMNSVMKEFNITPNDYIIIYSDYFSVTSNALKQVPVSHIISIDVEWFQPYQYKFGKMDPRYIIWNIYFNYKLKKINKFFPISRYLAKHIESKNNTACVIPFMTDSTEVPLTDIVTRKNGVTNLIYSGSATNKDSFLCMIESIYRLDESERKKLCLHFTSLKKEVLKECLEKNAYYVDELSSCLKFHGWLEYDELLELYRNMDFTFLAREKNKVTLSNFPSKIPELMAYSVIPLCSDVGDYTELYMEDGKNAILFERDETESCTSAIRKALSLSNDELLIMKKEARKTVENKFDFYNWTSTVRNYISNKESK